MKKITIKEFQALVARPDWVAEMEQILVERLEVRSLPLTAPRWQICAWCAG